MDHQSKTKILKSRINRYMIQADEFVLAEKYNKAKQIYDTIAENIYKNQPHFSLLETTRILTNAIAINKMADTGTETCKIHTYIQNKIKEKIDSYEKTHKPLPMVNLLDIDYNSTWRRKDFEKIEIINPFIFLGAIKYNREKSKKIFDNCSKKFTKEGTDWKEYPDSEIIKDIYRAQTFYANTQFEKEYGISYALSSFVVSLASLPREMDEFVAFKIYETMVGKELENLFDKYQKAGQQVMEMTPYRQMSVIMADTNSIENFLEKHNLNIDKMTPEELEYANIEKLEIVLDVFDQLAEASVKLSPTLELPLNSITHLIEDEEKLPLLKLGNEINKKAGYKEFFIIQESIEKCMEELKTKKGKEMVYRSKASINLFPEYNIIQNNTNN
jgi:hypothetical protein